MTKLTNYVYVDLITNDSTLYQVICAGCYKLNIVWFSVDESSTTAFTEVRSKNPIEHYCVMH